MRRRLIIGVVALLLVLVTPGVAQADYVWPCAGEVLEGEQNLSGEHKVFEDASGKYHARWVITWDYELVGQDTGTVWRWKFRSVETVLYDAETYGELFTRIHLTENARLVPMGGPGPVLLIHDTKTLVMIDGEVVVDSWDSTIKCVGPEGAT